MALLAALGTAASYAAPYVLPAVAAATPWLLGKAAGGVRKFKEWRDPAGFRRQQILKQVGATPEQYQLRRQSLSRALQGMRPIQDVFHPRMAQMQQAGDITAGLPTQVGTAPQPQYARGLSGLLGAMDQAARSGYQTDLAQIGVHRGPVRNPLGRTSGQLAMMQDALRNRMTGLAQSRAQLLGDFATRNAMAQLEAGNLGLQRDEANTALTNFLNQLRQQQQQGVRADYLGQMQQNIGEAGLQNILGAEQQQQAVRQFQIGQQPAYTAQRVPQQLGGI